MSESIPAEATATTGPPALVEEIRRANEAFLAFPRSGGDADAILEAKLDAAYWRRATAERLISDAEAGALDPGSLGEALVELGLALDPQDRERVERLISDRDLLARVFARQGVRLADVPERHRLAGPTTQLDIKVNRASPWPFARWREIEELSEYEYRDDGVFYRGVHLLPGDLILPNVNLDGNIVYSMLSDPHALYSHSAIFTVLEHDGKRFPAVVETFEKGLRAIPLCVFFNEGYSSYAEVYRHREMNRERRSGVSGFVLGAMDRVRGYNFDPTEFDDPTYVSCTMFGQWVYADAGLGRMEIVSGIRNPGIVYNLGLLDYHDLDPFLTPVDFVLNEAFDLVGVVDNNKFDRLLTRELLQAKFRDQYASRPMIPSRLPIMFRPNEWAIGHMRRRTLIGRLISKATGWDDKSLPKGPDPLIAAIGLAEAKLTKITHRMVPIVAERVRELGRFDFQEMLADPVISGALAAELRFPWLPEAPPGWTWPEPAER